MRERAVDALRGLALGDAFGDQWFRRPAATVAESIARRDIAEWSWPWTDDTAMALSLMDVLHEHGRVEQGALATAFAAAYRADPHRKYGPSMHGVLTAIGAGEGWAEVTGRQFGGQGSWGNGAAMRVAPLGVWFAEDLALVAEQAHAQAVVTHAHPEASAGAIAVAVAAALSVRGVPGPELVEAVLAHVPPGDVAGGLARAARLSPDTAPPHAAAMLGSGYRVSAPDTVPYAIWCAARHLDDLTEALWATVSGQGDMDTTGAMVGGIIAGRTGRSGVPEAWWAACESIEGRGRVSGAVRLR